jgi:hypothetical protein
MDLMTVDRDEPPGAGTLREAAAHWAAVRAAGGTPDGAKISAVTRAAAEALGLEPSALEDILQVWCDKSRDDAHGRRAERLAREAKDVTL